LISLLVVLLIYFILFLLLLSRFFYQSMIVLFLIMVLSDHDKCYSRPTIVALFSLIFSWKRKENECGYIHLPKNTMFPLLDVSSKRMRYLFFQLSTFIGFALFKRLRFSWLSLTTTAIDFYSVYAWLNYFHHLPIHRQFNVCLFRIRHLVLPLAHFSPLTILILIPLSHTLLWWGDVFIGLLIIFHLHL
jgi:hypothetical protein